MMSMFMWKNSWLYHYKLLECSACGCIIPASTKSTHDKWQCSRKNLQTFCGSCHACFDHSHIEEHQKTCTPVVVPEEPRPVLAASRPIYIRRSIRLSESDHEFVPSPGYGSVDSASSLLVLHGSGCHSLSSSSDSNHGTSSLTCLEITALCEAIKEIPEISPSSENTSEIKSEWTENETQNATCDFDIWNDHRMSPASRSVLKKIDALFYRPKTDSSP